MSFVNSSTISKLPNLSPREADALAHGAVRLDDKGGIEVYNAWEAKLAGLQQNDAIGKNFFTQIAPCTMNRLVYGRFKEGVAAGKMDHEFDYTFTYKMKPTNVKLRLYRGADTGNWVFVTAA